MKWNFADDRPIYSQLIEQIKQGIISGEYELGSKLPSVRDLAEEAGVNPNTMQKALSELEQTGIIFSKRTAGRFITENEELRNKMKAESAKSILQGFLDQMKNLGISKEEAIKLLKQTEE